MRSAPSKIKWRAVMELDDQAAADADFTEERAQRIAAFQAESGASAAELKQHIEDMTAYAECLAARSAMYERLWRDEHDRHMRKHSAWKHNAAERFRLQRLLSKAKKGTRQK